MGEDEVLVSLHSGNEAIQLIHYKTCCRFNTLVEVARYIPHETCISDVTLPAMSFGDSFCVSRKGRTEGGGWVQTAWLCLGLALKSSSLEPGGPLIFCPLHKWAEKTVV